MAADPKSFDYFRRGEPVSALPGKVDNTGLDYFRRGEPLNAIEPVSGTVSKSGADTGSLADTQSIAVTLSSDDANLLSPNVSNSENSNGWNSNVNVVSTQSSTVAHSGLYSTKMASVASGNMSIYDNSPIYNTVATPGAEYTFSAYLRADTVARSCQVSIYFRDASNVSVGTFNSGPIANTTTGWTLITERATAPATAAKMTVVIAVLATGSAGEVHYADDMTLVRNSTETQQASSAFTTPDTGTGSDSQSISTSRSNSDTGSATEGWSIAVTLASSETTSGSDNAVASNSISSSDSNFTPANVLAEQQSTFETGVSGWHLPGSAGFTPSQSLPPSGTQPLRAHSGTYSMFVGQTGAGTSPGYTDAFAVTPGQPWTASGWLMNIGSTFTVTASVIFQPTSVVAVSPTSTVSSSVSVIGSGGWQKFTVTGYAPVGANFVRLSLSAAGTGHSYYVDDLYLGLGTADQSDSQSTTTAVSSSDIIGSSETQSLLVVFSESDSVVADDEESAQETYRELSDSDDGNWSDEGGFPLWDEPAESIEITTLLESDDSGILLEAASLSASTHSQDLVAASEGNSLAAAPSTYETGQGTEGSVVSVALSGSDSGAIAESEAAVEIFRPVSGSDSGIFTESEVVFEVSRAVVSSDSGVSIESQSLTTQSNAFISQSELVMGGESEHVSVTLSNNDNWTGQDAQTIQATGSSNDQASGQDNQNLRVLVDSADNGSAGESQDLRGQEQGLDSGSFIDGWSVSSGITDTDSGVLTEGETVYVLVSGSDTVHGVDDGVLRIRPGLRPCLTTKRLIETFGNSRKFAAITTQRELVSASSSRSGIVINTVRKDIATTSEAGCGQ